MSRPFAGIQRGMTDSTVVARLGPPTRTMTGRDFSRDSVMWSLVGQDPTPRRAWSFSMTDAELSREIAAGDTLYWKLSLWERRPGDRPGEATRTWRVNYQRTDGVWTVGSAEDQSDALQF